MEMRDFSFQEVHEINHEDYCFYNCSLMAHVLQYEYRSVLCLSACVDLSTSAFEMTRRVVPCHDGLCV